jgi:hypothetical protein
MPDVPAHEIKIDTKEYDLMIRNMRTAVKFFVYGLLAGLLFAPRSGAETRKELMNWVGNSMKGITG